MNAIFRMEKWKNEKKKTKANSFGSVDCHMQMLVKKIIIFFLLYLLFITFRVMTTFRLSVFDFVDSHAANDSRNNIAKYKPTTIISSKSFKIT